MKQLFQRVIFSTFFKGGLYIYASNIISGFINYIYVIASGRLLGPAEFGDFSVFFSYISIVSIPFATIGTVLIQKIGKREEKKAFISAIKEWVLMLFKKYWIVFVILIASIPIISPITKLSIPLSSLLILFIFVNLYSTLYDAFLLGLNKFNGYFYINVLSVLIKLSGVLFGHLLPFPLIILALAFDLSLIAKMFLGQWIMHREYPKQKNNAIKIDKTILAIVMDKQFIMTLGSYLAIVLLSSADMIFAKQRFSATDAGLFAAWLVFAKMISFSLAPFNNLSYMFFTNISYRKYHRQFILGALLILCVIGFAINILYSMFDAVMIRFFFGDAYLPLKPFVEWSSLFAISYTIVQFINNYFLAVQKVSSWILPLSAPIYIVSLLIYPQSFGELIYFNTFFMLCVLAIHLLVMAKDRFTHLIHAFSS